MSEKVINISGVPNEVLAHLTPNEQKYGLVTLANITDACFVELESVEKIDNEITRFGRKKEIMDFMAKMCKKADDANWIREYQRYTGFLVA